MQVSSNPLIIKGKTSHITTVIVYYILICNYRMKIQSVLIFDSFLNDDGSDCTGKPDLSFSSSQSSPSRSSTFSAFSVTSSFPGASAPSAATASTASSGSTVDLTRWHLRDSRSTAGLSTCTQSCPSILMILWSSFRWVQQLAHIRLW